MFDWKEYLGGFLTKLKDFYVERPNVTMFCFGFLTATVLILLLL